MSDVLGCIPEGNIYAEGPYFVQQLQRYLGETVTIFTTSGGESGSGFTGVLGLVTPEYVRLVTAIGFPPDCSLGNECDFEEGFCRGARRGFGRGFERGFDRRRRSFGFGLGSVVDIPTSRIASFAHNTL
jgi:hypothetical protein